MFVILNLVILCLAYVVIDCCLTPNEQATFREMMMMCAFLIGRLKILLLT